LWDAFLGLVFFARSHERSNHFITRGWKDGVVYMVTVVIIPQHKMVHFLEEELNKEEWRFKSNREEEIFIIDEIGRKGRAFGTGT
jgi:hypothetical protein